MLFVTTAPAPASNTRAMDPPVSSRNPEAINERNWDHLWGLHVDNIVMSSPDLPEPAKGREAVQERLQAWGEALPDLSWTRVRGFGQGDWICVELLITGTHKGPLRHGFDRRLLPAESGGVLLPPRDRIQALGF